MVPPGTYRDPITRSAPSSIAASSDGSAAGSCDRSESISIITSSSRARPSRKPARYADPRPDFDARLGNVSVLRRASKSGLGSAYRAGFREGLARELDVMIEMDSDLSHDPAALPSLLAAIDEGADLVIGSRYVPGGTIPNWRLHRRLLSRWGNRYAGFVLGLPVSDSTAGYRAYRATALEKVDLDAV